MRLLKLGTSLALILLQISTINPSSITFCDGQDGKLEKSREQCSSGYNFGDSRPDCVCIKGIYRIWTDSCETADGFAEEVCTKLQDESTNSNIVGMKLTNDPVDWSQTGVVCEKKSFGGDGWDLITENTRGSSIITDNMYVMNGKAVITSKGSICVSPAVLPETEKICKYFKQDNANLWKKTEIEIDINSNCKGETLKSSSCFGTLKMKDSECQLHCQPKGRSMMSSKGSQGRSLSNNKSRPTPTPLSRNRAPVPKSGISTWMTNISNPVDFRKHDNNFLNRKMLIYNVITQVEEGKPNSTKNTSSYGEPVKTFELFDLMKEVTKKFCPSDYVNPEWIDLAIEMFYILHKGNVYRYEEPISQEQYEWIKDILTQCDANMTSIQLSMQGSGSGGGSENPTCGAGGKATGYCNGTNSNGCNFRPASVGGDRANSAYHYVPDVAWDVLDLVQVACFVNFNASYRMFHVLEQASEKLFTLQIKNLWYYPGWSAKTRTKLLGAGADLQMFNLEMCIESAYDRNGMIPRLVRPMPPKYIRKRRATDLSISKNSQVYCSKSKKDFNYPKNCVGTKS